MATSTRRAPVARVVRKAGRSVARIAQKTARVTAEKIELLSPNTPPERKIAISRTTKRRVVRKGSDKEIVKAFGKKPAASSRRTASAGAITGRRRQ